jgi:hypothetical protein
MGLPIYEQHLYTTASFASLNFPLLSSQARSRAGHLTRSSTLSHCDANVSSSATRHLYAEECNSYHHADIFGARGCGCSIV